MPCPALTTNVPGDPASGARIRLEGLVAKSPMKVESRYDSSVALMNCACGGDIPRVATVVGWPMSVMSRTTIWPPPRSVTNARLTEDAGVALAMVVGELEGTAPAAGPLPEPQPAASNAGAATS